MSGFADSARVRNGVVVLLVIFFAVASWGQTSTASIFGTAADASGASVIGAQVTATNSATGVSRTVATNDSGNYTIPFLPVGTYTVDVKKSGFQTFVRNNVVVGVGANIRVDPVLKLGSVATAVNVTSELPQINTLDASVGHTVDNVEVQNLPLVNRDPYSFLTLTPGVTSNTTNNAL